MPGIVRKDVDNAGGKLLAGSDNVFANNKGVSRLGDAVEPHAPVLSPHFFGPTMKEASDNVFANGIAVCRAGDKATCDHPATGSSDVFVN